MILYGPELSADRTYDHSGLGVEYNVNFDWVFGLHRNTVIAPIVGIESDTLRPVDFTGLTNNRKFTQDFAGFVFRSSPWRQLTFNINGFRQGAVNVVVPTGQLPNEADETTVNGTMSVKPLANLQIANTYILARFNNNPADPSDFANTTTTSKPNYHLHHPLSHPFTT